MRTNNLCDRSVVLCYGLRMVDGRVVRGDRTRQAVLDAAVAAASVEGLTGLSLGRLAAGLGVSKSGLFAHWSDKQALQLEIIEHARRQWAERIVAPALEQPRGVRRLWALHERRLAFYLDGVLPGGCFFAAVEGEFDDKPGPVRDAIAAALEAWMQLLARLVTAAVRAGELRPDVPARQLAFEIQALGEAAVMHTHLLRQPRSYDFARRAVLDRLRALATDPSLLPEA
jgi:AcrR family transcriptional regulator